MKIFGKSKQIKYIAQSRPIPSCKVALSRRSIPRISGEDTIHLSNIISLFVCFVVHNHLNNLIALITYLKSNPNNTNKTNKNKKNNKPHDSIVVMTQLLFVIIIVTEWVHALMTLRSAPMNRFQNENKRVYLTRRRNGCVPPQRSKILKVSGSVNDRSTCKTGAHGLLRAFKYLQSGY